jgi:hypothetical protein
MSVTSDQLTRGTKVDGEHEVIAPASILAAALEFFVHACSATTATHER